MNHPLVMYDLAKLRIADDLRQAERERLVRQAGQVRAAGAIDAVPFLERLTRIHAPVGDEGPRPHQTRATPSGVARVFL